MILINDPKGLLNLNIMTIYLMLTPDDYSKYANKLKDLIKYSSLTKDIFHFEIIEKGEPPFQNLPKEMVHNMRHYNVLARLVDSINEIFCYALDEIDFKGGIPSAIMQLQEFVERVCQENIIHLDILGNRTTITSAMKVKKYADNKINTELYKTALQSHFTGVLADLIEDKLQLRRRSVTVTLKRMKTGKVLKDGTEKKKLGIELDIDGTIKPIFFASTDETILYAGTLMAIREGYNFIRSNSQEQNKPWLKRLYHALNFRRDFDEWYLGVKEDPHPFDVAVSHIKKILWSELKEYPDVYHMCEINNKGRYTTRLRRRSIIIDPSILKRLE